MSWDDYTNFYDSSSEDPISEYDDILYTSQRNKDYVPHVKQPFIITFFTYSIFPIVLTGVVCNIIIIATILKYRQLHTRTNLLLVAYAVTDIGTKIFDSAIIYNLHILQNNLPNRCLILQASLLCQVCRQSNIVALFSNSLMQMHRSYAYKVTIAVLVAIGCGILGRELVQDKCENILTFMLVFINLAMLLVLIFKECYYLYRNCRNQLQLNEDEKFRFNIVRIYVYVAVLRMLFDMLGTIFHGGELTMILMTVGYEIESLTPMYLLIYVMSANYRIKACFLSIFTCNSDGKDDVNTTVLYVKDNQQVDVETANND